MRVRTCLRYFQLQLVAEEICDSCSHFRPQTATIPPGLLIPRSQVRSLPGPLRAEVRPLRGHDDFRAFELESRSRVADAGEAGIGGDGFAGCRK